MKTLPARLFFAAALLLATAARAGDVHDAVQAEDTERVRALVSANPSLRLELDDSKRTPLHWAVLSSDASLWTLVFDPKALEMYDFVGLTPVHLAAMNRDTVEPLTGLLARGAPADRPTRVERATPLHWAAEQGNVQAMRILLDHGADLHAQQLSGATTLHLAAGRSRNPEAVRLLLARGAKVDALNHLRMTPLLNAAASGQKEIVTLLLAAGADPKHRDAAGRDARSLAERGKHADVAALFKE